MTASAISVTSLSKSYRPRGRRTWFMENVLSAARGRKRPPRPMVWALKDISFEIQAGRSVGIVGSNGAGKSTLLRVLAGISDATSGDVAARGRISTQLGIGLGFNTYLSGRENVYLEGTVLGLTNAVIRTRMKSITDFAGLDGAIDNPLWTYSSGMVARLGFAVAAHADFDILLLDEALNAGDLAFQERCDAALARFRDEGRTLVMVSHNHEQVRHLCDEAIWLQKGQLQLQGPTEHVVTAYEAAR